MGNDGGRYPDFADGTPNPVLPSEVMPISDDQLRYVIEGHRWGAGIDGKTEMPQRWLGHEREYVQRVLDHPQSSEPDPRTGRVRLRGVVDSVTLLIVLDRLGKGWRPWEVVSIYPLWGFGVRANEGERRAPIESPAHAEALARRARTRARLRMQRRGGKS